MQYTMPVASVGESQDMASVRPELLKWPVTDLSS